MLDSSCRRAEPVADYAFEPDAVDATSDHVPGAADAERPPGKHSRTDPAAESAADRHGAVCACDHRQRPVRNDAGNAQQHRARNGANRDAGHGRHHDTGSNERAAARRVDPQWKQDTGTARERSSTKHGARTEYGQPSIHDDVDAASGIVGGLSCADDCGKRRDARCDPTAVYAGHRPGCGDDAASDAEHAVNRAGDARSSIDSSDIAPHAGRAGHDDPRHVESAGDPEPVVAWRVKVSP
jgi:hypothetical protein